MNHLYSCILLFTWTTVAQPQTFHQFMTSTELEKLLGVKATDDIPEYEVVTPFQVDHKGDYLTHDLTTAHTRARREAHYLLGNTAAHFEFTAFGKRHRMSVKPHRDFLAPGFFTQIYRDNDTVDLDFELTLCHFVGELTSHTSPSHVAISNCQGLMGVIMTDEGTTFVQPIPDYLVGSNDNQNHTHVVYKRRTTEQGPSTRFECGVQGSISPVKYNSSRAVEENIERGSLKKENVMDSSGSNLGGRYVIEAIVVADTDMYRKHGRNARNVKRYIVTLMNIASSLYNVGNLGFNVKLVLTRIQLFTSFSAQRGEGLYTGNVQDSKALLATFSKWQAKNKPRSDSDPLNYDHAFFFVGRGMCHGKNKDCWELGRAWIEGMCKTDYSCSVISDKGLQVGFVVAHEIGHSLGMLHDGANGKCKHEDGYLMKSTTANAQRIFLFSLCSKIYLLAFLRYEEMHCLKDAPASWEYGFGRDYYSDSPGRIYSRDQQCKLSYGKNATYCYKEPHLADPEICMRMWCDDKEYPVCVTTYTGAADGTPCDAPFWRGDKVCYRRQCVSKSLLLKPQLSAHEDFRTADDPITIHPHILNPPTAVPTSSILYTTAVPTSSISSTLSTSSTPCIPNSSHPVINGQWRLWSAFTPCGRTCGGGFRYRERQCSNPLPSNCGHGCHGKSTDVTFCNPAPCLGIDDYRQKQCTGYDQLKPGVHLVPDYNVPKEEECRLKCISVSDVKHIVRALEAQEGTHCNNRTNNRCFFGKCHPVGCDNIYGSNKQTDRCGVCGGNGYSRNCKTYTNSYNLSQQWSGYYEITEIPVLASQIRISEKIPSSSIFLGLSYSDGRPIFNGNHTIEAKNQTTTAAGTYFVYTRSALAVETITAAGPINQELIVRILYNHTRGRMPEIVYSYDLPKSVPLKDRAYSWLFKRPDCSVTCGQGTVTTDARCARQTSGVEADISMCFGLSLPPLQTETCNVGDCQIPSYNWVPDSWTGCSRTCGNGFQTRQIVCRNNTTERNVASSYCHSLTRPESNRSCELAGCLTYISPTPKFGDWLVGDWSVCSKTCGDGKQTRSVSCLSGTCILHVRPDAMRVCKLANCCKRDRNAKVCQLMLASSCMPDCTNNIISRFCCKSCSPIAKEKIG